jgi:hypothetical protein
MNFLHETNPEWGPKLMRMHFINDETMRLVHEGFVVDSIKQYKNEISRGKYMR